MLSSDEPIALLIEKLDALPRPDRAAILKRLNASQRAAIERLRTASLVQAEQLSAQLAARVAQLHDDASPLTIAARKALARAVSAHRPMAQPMESRGASLADVAGGLFRSGRRG